MLQTAIGFRNLSQAEQNLIKVAAHEILNHLNETHAKLPKSYDALPYKIKAVYLSKLLRRINSKTFVKNDNSWVTTMMTAIFQTIRKLLSQEITSNVFTIRSLIRDAFLSVFASDGITELDLPAIEQKNFHVWDDLLVNLEEVLVIKPTVLCSGLSSAPDIKISEYDYKDAIKFLKSLNFNTLPIYNTCNLKNG